MSWTKHLQYSYKGVPLPIYMDQYTLVQLFTKCVAFVTICTILSKYYSNPLHFLLRIGRDDHLYKCETYDTS